MSTVMRKKADTRFDTVGTNEVLLPSRTLKTPCNGMGFFIFAVGGWEAMVFPGGCPMVIG